MQRQHWLKWMGTQKSFFSGPNDVLTITLTHPHSFELAGRKLKVGTTHQGGTGPLTPIPGVATSVVPAATSPVIVLKNMIAPEDVDENLEEEVQEECSQYGVVVESYQLVGDEFAHFTPTLYSKRSRN